MKNRWKKPKNPLLPSLTCVTALVGGGFFAWSRQGPAPRPSGVNTLLVQPAGAAEWHDPALADIIEAQRKRVMGRMRTHEHVERVATTLRPAVDAALRDPSNQETLRALAQSAGMTVEQYREYFAGKQEADLLLESGGDPNARSVSDAIGVAQFMVGTGQRCGLKINIGASNRLSRKIEELDEAIEWLEMQPADFVRPLPKGSHAPGAPYTREQWLDMRRAQRDQLVAKRRIVDERFDPAKSVRVQTRYLLRLTRRYGGVDWALQAYHGGEGGASKTAGLYLRSAGGAYTLSSRGSGGRSSWPAYSDLYKRVTPTAAPAAFSYLYGRSDDHRNYWWKVLMAEQALALYHRDPEEFKRQWQALKPGYSTDVVYYPEPEPLQFPDGPSLREAYRAGEIVPLPPSAPKMGLKTDVATLDPSSAPLLKGLRPEAMGALLRLARQYRSHGGKTPLVLTGMVRSAGYQALWDAKYPRRVVGGAPPDPEYHTTGLVFDIRRPQRDWDRKVLEYALGTLHDSLRIAYRKEGGDNGGPARYHVTPNPRFKGEFIAEIPPVTRLAKGRD